MIEVVEAKLAEQVIVCQRCKGSQIVEMPRGLLEAFHCACPECGGAMIGAIRRYEPEMGRN